MRSGVMFGVPAATWRIATLIGLAIGAVYVLSPLSVWFVIAMYVLLRKAPSGLPDDERRWMTALLAVAIALRVIPVAALFATTNHAQVAFGTFFGDEEFYLRRSIWLRNVALHLPIHSADLIYAFDDSGWTSHLYVLAFLHTLVGPSPYAVHLAGIAIYLLATVVLYRAIRPAFGRVPALLGLAFVLFLPSLFAWSISVLKEPVYFLLVACTVSLTIRMVRDRRWMASLLALAAILALAAALQTIREQGGALTLAGLACGLAMAAVMSRPRVLIAVVIAVPIVAGAALSRPAAQVRTYLLVKAAARQHWGHVETPGWVYTLLDPRFYSDRSSMADMRFNDTVQYVGRALERYVTVPLPWEIKSDAALADLPEQVLWYCVVLLLPVGVIFSLRRDVLVTSVLTGMAAVAVVSVALTSGNVGTLVRHRSLAMPYLIWMSAVGLSELLARAGSRKAPALEEAKPVWP